MPHEQMCLSLLLPGRKHNSVRNVIPLANALDEKESYNLLEIMNKAVDPQLPRGEKTLRESVILNQLTECVNQLTE